MQASCSTTAISEDHRPKYHHHHNHLYLHLHHHHRHHNQPHNSIKFLTSTAKTNPNQTIQSPSVSRSSQNSQKVNNYVIMSNKLFNLKLNLAALLCVAGLGAYGSPLRAPTPATQQNATSADSFEGLYSMFGGGNPQRTPDGRSIVEGDIVASLDGPNGRKANPDSSLYWPNGEVVYTFHESINQMEMNVIMAAMQHWSQHTCISFRPKGPSDYAFVRFRSDTQGCWSLVGRQTDRIGQDVSIGQGCANLNVVVHEIGHVIGFYHEQSRSDRDQYIEIVWDNVLPGYGLQFRKEQDNNLNIPYDLTSTMQYPQWAFSREIFEKSTIVAKNPAYQRFLSKNYPLSFRDRILANHLYQCVQPCQAGGASNGACQNGGYMRSTSPPGSSVGSAAGCACDCPPNFAGSQCEQALRDDYYDALPCGGVVSSEGKIETPNYPQRLQPFESCMWDIRAPENKQVSLRFDGFEFAPRFTKAGTKVINKCFNETIEIRLKSANMYDGQTFCGNDIAPGTVLRSDGSRAIIIITANDRMLGSGLSARVKFLEPNQPDTDTDGDTEVVTTDNEIDTGDTPSPKPTTPVWPEMVSLSTARPPPPQPPVFTFPPIIGVQTLPPVTIGSLLEEYEKESKKTLPPVMPPMLG